MVFGGCRCRCVCRSQGAHGNARRTACSYTESESRTCLKTGFAYETTTSAPNSDNEAVIGASWTRGLVVQPLATGVTFIALLLSLSQHILVMLLASIAAALAGALHLISFFIQIALFARVKDKMNDLDIGASTKPAPGFWLVFVSLILCFLAACTVCFGRRRDQAHARTANAVSTGTLPADTEKSGGFFSRFRK
ncbi:hypothetical protein FA13DRAFT_1729967 [Coprinellus micaceus]|uniref:Uncharacterized protein n=1 Tax=Coprinellus micaceus TaxID=71717 RepID=A0A4Y7THQ3_COPMI|nr:hypothetical protein FA13DRAFT_1729967 [Coprinellus micaceus]